MSFSPLNGLGLGEILHDDRVGVQDEPRRDRSGLLRREAIGDVDLDVNELVDGRDRCTGTRIGRAGTFEGLLDAAADRERVDADFGDDAVVRGGKAQDEVLQLTRREHGAADTDAVDLGHVLHRQGVERGLAREERAQFGDGHLQNGHRVDARRRGDRTGDGTLAVAGVVQCLVGRHREFLLNLGEALDRLGVALGGPLGDVLILLDERGAAEIRGGLGTGGAGLDVGQFLRDVLEALLGVGIAGGGLGLQALHFVEQFDAAVSQRGVGLSGRKIGVGAGRDRSNRRVGISGLRGCRLASEKCRAVAAGGEIGEGLLEAIAIGLGDALG
ncbi:MAG: hypothetical protein ACK55I_15405, partial [bacterium]